MAKIDIDKKIEELKGQITANELLLNNIILEQPKNYWLKKYLGTFTSLFLISGIIQIIMALFFIESFFQNLIIMMSATFLFSIIGANDETLYMFDYLKESLNLSAYEQIIHRKSYLEKMISTDKATIDVLNHLLRNHVKTIKK